jgi:glutamyl-tRNA synthetase
MDWKDPKSEETTTGFREKGFLPEAFLNMLVLLGWNDGSGQEIFTMEEMIARFNIERVHKAGAKFDYEKAKWFNHQYIQQKQGAELAALVRPFIQAHGVTPEEPMLIEIVDLIKERCSLLSDFWDQGHFFFRRPESPDLAPVKDKWSEAKTDFFRSWADSLGSQQDWTHTSLEDGFTALAAEKGIKKGELQLPLRIMLVGGKYGPGVFQIAEIIGKEETVARIEQALGSL